VSWRVVVRNCIVKRVEEMSSAESGVEEVYC
jgi:hypothetical protein